MYTMFCNFCKPNSSRIHFALSHWQTGLPYLIFTINSFNKNGRDNEISHKQIKFHLQHIKYIFWTHIWRHSSNVLWLVVNPFGTFLLCSIDYNGAFCIGSLGCYGNCSVYNLLMTSRLYGIGVILVRWNFTPLKYNYTYF